MFLATAASAGVLLVRQPLTLRDATAEDCKFIAEAIGFVAGRHGLKDRTFTAPDHRIFVIFESPGRMVGRREGDRAVIAFYFEAREREACDAIYRDLEGHLLRKFRSRITGTASEPKRPNKAPEPTPGSVTPRATHGMWE